MSPHVVSVGYDKEHALEVTSPTLRVQPAGYGLVIEDPQNGEWAAVLQWTSRQDGRTAWLLCLTQCDDIVRVKSGVTRWAQMPAEIAAALHDITTEARWHVPFQTGVHYVNPEACPGCGCMPGDGRTPGCTHHDGCGYDGGAL